MMKKTLSTVLVLCLIVALLPVIAVTAQAASGSIENCLQFVDYYNETTEEWASADQPCVLVKNGDHSLIITTLAPKSGWATAFRNPATGKWNLTEYEGDWNKILHIYEADPSFGAQQGFLSLGTITQNEKMKYVGLNNEGTVVVETVALDYEDGFIIPKDSVSTDYTVAVLNSKNEICAIEYGGVCIVLGATDEQSFYGNNGPQEQSPATDPAPTEPAATDPAPTEPAATDPAPTEPPASESQNSGMEQISASAVELKDLEKIFEDAVVQKKASKTGIIVLVSTAVLIAALSGAVIVVKRRNKKKRNEELNEAEEGTVLAERPVDTGLRLQFRNGRRIAVKHGFSIGRAPGNDIVIPASSNAVSGRHCEILVQNGAVYLRDLGSTNGTFINGRKLVAGQLVQLLPGMTVTLGGPSGTEGFNVVLSSE